MPVDKIKEFRRKLIAWEHKNILRYGSFLVILIGIVTRGSDILYWAENNFVLKQSPHEWYFPFLVFFSSIIFILMMQRKHLKWYFILPAVLTLVYSVFEGIVVLRSLGMIP